MAHLITHRSALSAVIFDIDGTLLDSVDLHAMAWSEALRHFGFDPPYCTVRSQIGKGGDQLLRTLLGDAEYERIGQPIDDYRGDLFKKKYMRHAVPFALVPELFKRCRKAGLRTALASSAKPDEVEVYKRILGIEHLVDISTSAGDAECSKPCPDIFAAALDRLGNPAPSQVIAVGDSPYDAEAATALGIETVGVLCGGFPGHELLKAGCSELFSGPAGLFARFYMSPLGRRVRQAA